MLLGVVEKGRDEDGIAMELEADAVPVEAVAVPVTEEVLAMESALDVEGVDDGLAEVPDDGRVPVELDSVRLGVAVARSVRDVLVGVRDGLTGLVAPVVDGTVERRLAGEAVGVAEVGGGLVLPP